MIQLFSVRSANDTRMLFAFSSTALWTTCPKIRSHEILKNSEKLIWNQLLSAATANVLATLMDSSLHASAMNTSVFTRNLSVVRIHPAFTLLAVSQARLVC